MKNLTAKFLAETEIAINRAVSISDVIRIARVVGGYRIARAAVAFTASDLAWFRKAVAS